MKFKLVSQEFVVSVGRRHSNSGKRRHFQPKKRYWTVYFYDEGGVFRSKRVSFLKAMYYKTKKVKVIDK